LLIFEVAGDHKSAIRNKQSEINTVENYCEKQRGAKFRHHVFLTIH